MGRWADCRGEVPPMAVRPEDWEAELEGPPPEGVGDGGPPVFSWSFSAFRFSTVLCGTHTHTHKQSGRVPIDTQSQGVFHLRFRSHSFP